MLLEPLNSCQNLGTGDIVLHLAKWQQLLFEVLKCVFILGHEQRCLNMLQIVCANASFDFNHFDFSSFQKYSLLLTLYPRISSLKICSSPLTFYLEETACFVIVL